MTGGAFGRGIDANIKDAYLWLVDNYAPGDQIYLFGFSRGAYTVRSTVGMIRKCGLLQKNEAGRLEEAYQLYRRRDDTADSEQAKSFRAAYSTEVEIACLGVWDTVGSLGIPLVGLRFLTLRKSQFHDVKLSRTVRRGYHAVAIDERRKPFLPTLWEVQPSPTQIVEQVWFAGVHSNVGGGYPDRGLSDLAFLWMMQKAEEAGLFFNDSYLQQMRPDLRGNLYDSKTGLYAALGTHVRRIGADSSKREAAAKEAVDRLRDATTAYDAPNLSEYMNSPAAAVAEPVRV